MFRTVINSLGIALFSSNIDQTMFYAAGEFFVNVVHINWNLLGSLTAAAYTYKSEQPKTQFEKIQSLKNGLDFK